MRHSDRWNPLEENENITDVQTSADVIISNTQKHDKGGDEFWPRAEENLLKAFQFKFLENISDQNTLTNVYKNIANGDITEIDRIFKSVPEDSPARMSYNIFASGSDTIKASVITGLGTRLQMFQNEDLQKLTSTSDIDLTLPGKQPCIYYVITSDMNSSFDFLASLFYTFLFIKLVRYADSRADGKCENEVFCFLDEFANIGQIPDFNKKISTVRSRRYSFNTYTTKCTDNLEIVILMTYLKKLYGNCDTRIDMGITDVLTADYFCKLLGVSTVETVSVKKSNSIEGDIEEYGQKSISVLQRNLLNIDEILRLPSIKMILHVKGNKPLLLDKIIYKEHPLYKKLKDSPISEYNPKWVKNIPEKVQIKVEEKVIEKTSKKEKLGWHNF